MSVLCARVCVCDINMSAHTEANKLSPELAAAALQSLNVQLSELLTSKRSVYQKQGDNLFFLTQRPRAVDYVRRSARELCAATSQRCPPQFEDAVAPLVGDDYLRGWSSIDDINSEDAAIEAAAVAELAREGIGVGSAKQEAKTENSIRDDARVATKPSNDAALSAGAGGDESVDSKQAQGFQKKPKKKGFNPWATKKSRKQQPDKRQNAKQSADQIAGSPGGAARSDGKERQNPVLDSLFADMSDDLDKVAAEHGQPNKFRARD